MDGREHIIVCGIDGSTAGQLALEWAVAEAIRRGCRLRVVTAWSWDGIELMGSASTPAAAHSHARQVQDVAVARALSEVDDPPEIEPLLPRSAPSDALCTAALDAELLVLGSHGHGAIHDKLVGSTSQRAIHHASCPVVILPDPRHVERELRHAKGKRRHAEAPPATPMF